MGSVGDTRRRTMDRWAGKIAIVTGASSGIGAEIARQLTDHKVIVVGLARRVNKMEELAEKLGKKKFYPVQCDLKKEEDILKAFEWTEKKFGGVDILVNNAGMVVYGSIADSTTESFRSVMDLNVLAMAICSRELIRSVKKRNAEGHIINMNSIAGHFAESLKYPIGLYCASKYAVTGLTLSLRNEFITSKLNIKVTSVSPGAVKTDMISKVGISDAVFQSMPMLADKDVADAVIYAIGTPPGAEIAEVTIRPNEAGAAAAAV